MTAAKREKGIDVQPIFSLSLPETTFSKWNDETMIVDFLSAWIKLELKNSGARLSHSRSGLGYLKSRERERERGSFIIRGRFKEPCLSKEGETSKKTGARWMVRRGHCSKGNSAPHYPALFLLEDEEGRRKEAGFTWQETFASLTKGLRAHYFMPYLVSWFTSCHGD